MKSQYSFLILAVLLSMQKAWATSFISDPYDLPPTKAYLDDCQKKALRLHEGSIEKQNLLHRDNHFVVQYEIYAGNGKIWLVSCDLATGNLVEQNEEENKL